MAGRLAPRRRAGGCRPHRKRSWVAATHTLFLWGGHSFLAWFGPCVLQLKNARKIEVCEENTASPLEGSSGSPTVLSSSLFSSLFFSLGRVAKGGLFGRVVAKGGRFLRSSQVFRSYWGTREILLLTFFDPVVFVVHINTSNSFYYLLVIK